MDDSEIICDEVKSHTMEKGKLFQQIIMKKILLVKQKTSIF